MSLSIGKIRGLQQLTDNGIFKIIAIDHRDVFINMMKSANKKYDTTSITNEKLEIIKLTNRNISGYLVDTHFSLPMGIYSQAIAGDRGFMVGYEDNDYSVKNFNENYFIDGLTVDKIREIGGSAVKLFLYYNPDSEYCEKQEAVIAHLSKTCEKAAIPLLLEPVLYLLEGTAPTPQEKTQLVFRMLDRLSKFGIDIFKIDFPGDIEQFTEAENLSICNQVTEQLHVPWVIMSSGIGIEPFSRQLDIACRGGASGYVVGRALWQEYVEADGDRTAQTKQMQQRTDLLSTIADEKARKWSAIDGLIKAEFSQSNWFREDCCNE